MFVMLLFIIIIHDLTLLCVLRCFQDIVDQGQLRLTAVSDLSKIAIRDTTEDGCRVIDAELQQLDDDFSDLKLSVQVVKENVEKKLQDWADLWKKAEDLNTCLQNVELTLGSYQEYGGDLAEKKLLLEQIKVL